MDDHPLVAELKKQDDEQRIRLQSLQEQQNSRDNVVSAAGLEMVTWIGEWQKRHKITNAEFLWIFQNLQTRRLADMVNAERTSSK